MAGMVLVALLAALTQANAAMPTNTFVCVSAASNGKVPRKLVFKLAETQTLVLKAEGHSWGQAVWGEPVLIAKDGSKVRLVDLTPVSSQVGAFKLTLNQGPDKKPLKVGDREFEYGIFAHADSELAYRLDGKFTRFEAWIGINHTAVAPTSKRPVVVKFEARDKENYDWEQQVKLFQRGFTRDCFASLQQALVDERQRGAQGVARAEALAGKLAVFEKDFDSIRQSLEKDPEPVRDRLPQFVSLVHDIRVLKLDAPMLFVKRHAYFSGHIYDDQLTWHPGGGLYILENPAAPQEQQVVKPVIDPKTAETLGEGVYRDPDLSFDAKRILFAHKGEKDGDTSIYEIRVDGSGLRRLTDPTKDKVCHDKPVGLIGSGGHDYSPAYLPDGRIVFVSTRTAGLVMCFNNHIGTLHSMNADGSDIRSISCNNVTEFDPTVLPDGRILYGRWEYVDKTALYMQSLWTMNPDGTQETALFKNNMAKPTAVLDARPVPGCDLIVATLTPHNGQSVGAIAMLDTHMGKNNLAALTNFTPEYPTEMDQGVTHGPSDPWPLDKDTVVISNNAESHGKHSVLELIDRYGFRFVLRKEAEIGCFSPMLIKPQQVPPTRPSTIVAGEPAKFIINDVYQGMDGVKRGEVKQLRVLETTSRISGLPPGGRWWNQAFLVSWQGSYDVKRFIGVVPVEEDGSAYFEAPPGKPLYLQALDKDGRALQSMRTFVQAAPGVTRSCQGCHLKEDSNAPPSHQELPMAMRKPATKIQPESWGNGFLDYAKQVQPVLDRNCVKCHGGADGIAAGIDLSGGWTWAFNISYETLLKNTLSGFLNCNNGSVKTAEIQPPRTHGSGAAPLGELLVSGHKGRLVAMSKPDRDLLLAWMDENCNYYGNWDYTEQATCNAILPLRDKLLAEMQKGGCTKCHGEEVGNDWINLAAPAQSRILRAPLAKVSGGFGLGWCRDRKAQPVRLPLVTQKNQPPDVFKPVRDAAIDLQGNPVTTFADATSPAYQAMLAIIQQGREEALKTPRVDMPGAVVIRGQCRELPPLSPPVVKLDQKQRLSSIR